MRLLKIDCIPAYEFIENIFGIVKLIAGCVALLIAIIIAL